jgi:hypothetical protein
VNPTLRQGHRFHETSRTRSPVDFARQK